MSIERRFFSKTLRVGQCLEWTGAHDGLDKRSPDEAMRWWSDNNIGQAPAGAVAALGLCLEAIARLTHERDALFGKLAEVLYHE